MPPPKAKTTTSAETNERRANLVTPRPALEVSSPPDPKTIHGRLRICREAKGVTKAAVAKAAGVKASSVGDWENGDTRSPKPETLWNLRDRLGYDLEYVVRGKGMPLLPNYEEQIREIMLIGIFRELNTEMKDSLVGLAQNLRRAQGSGPSDVDPYRKDVPKPPNLGDN